jgi:hypothetical protein
MPTVKKPSENSAIKTKVQNYDFLEANMTPLHTKDSPWFSEYEVNLGFK